MVSENGLNERQNVHLIWPLSLSRRWKTAIGRSGGPDPDVFCSHICSGLRPDAAGLDTWLARVQN